MVLLNLKVVVEIQILRAIRTILTYHMRYCIKNTAFQQMSSEMEVMEDPTAMLGEDLTEFVMYLPLQYKQSELY